MGGSSTPQQRQWRTPRSDSADGMPSALASSPTLKLTTGRVSLIRRFLPKLCSARRCCRGRLAPTSSPCGYPTPRWPADALQRPWCLGSPCGLQLCPGLLEPVALLLLLAQLVAAPEQHGSDGCPGVDVRRAGGRLEPGTDRDDLVR